MLALAYALAGAIGLAMAIPPGYASPVFPAAGLALALTLHIGRRALPFVWLGALSLNIGREIAGDSLTWNTALVSAAIATGAMVQAELGRVLVLIKLRGEWRRLETEGQILGFLLRGGVLACLASATISVSTLAVLGLVSADAAPFCWWTWYTGDLLGVVIFAPLFVLYLNPDSELSQDRRRRIVIPIFVAFVISIFIYSGATHLERKELEDQVANNASKMAQLIQNRLINHQAVLSSVQHYAKANANFSRTQFETFTKAALERNPDIFALSFNDLVTRDELPAYEQEMARLSAMPGFKAMQRDSQKKLVPVANRSDYVIVRHIVPLKGNAPALGFDIGSEPVRRAAIESARASGQPAVTGPIHLVQENEVRKGVLALDPVLVEDGQPDLKLLGFAVAVLKVDEMVNIATQKEMPTGAKLYLRDAAMDDPSFAFSGKAMPTNLPSYQKWTTSLTIANRDWAMDYWVDDTYVSKNKSLMAWAIGAIAMLFTGLLQIYLHGITGLAHHDALTRLPNRTLGKQQAREAIRVARRDKSLVALLLFDLDHFKLINDTYGHSVGDRLLQELTKRLLISIRGEDHLCRLSGDEFMIVLTQLRSVEEAEAICQKLMAQVVKPIEIDGRMIQTSLSVGIAVYPQDGDDIENLVRKADTAMFKAKQDGRDTYRFFEPEMNRRVIEFVETRDELTQALKNGEFELFYQPQVRPATGEVVATEALIRWRHPKKGLVGPAKFIAVAEESGLIVPIGAWAIQEACRQMKAWIDSGQPMKTVAVNMSAVQFRIGDIEKTVMDALADSGLPPECLELELTESILISETDKALEIARRLKTLGVRLSIDDFGTGYSSLGYLQRLELDKIKIDSSFAATVDSNVKNRALVQAMIDMASALGLETTAEGVEEQAAVSCLQSMGCEQVQGYFYCKPLPAAQLQAWLSTRA